MATNVQLELEVNKLRAEVAQQGEQAAKTLAEATELLAKVVQLRAELGVVITPAPSTEELKAELAALKKALDQFMRADGVESVLSWSRAKSDAGVTRPVVEVPVVKEPTPATPTATSSLREATQILSDTINRERARLAQQRG